MAMNVSLFHRRLYRFQTAAAQSLEYASDTVTEEELKKILDPALVPPNLVGRICLNH